MHGLFQHLHVKLEPDVRNLAGLLPAQEVAAPTNFQIGRGLPQMAGGGAHGGSFHRNNSIIMFLWKDLFLGPSGAAYCVLRPSFLITGANSAARASNSLRISGPSMNSGSR